MRVEIAWRVEGEVGKGMESLCVRGIEGVELVFVEALVCRIARSKSMHPTLRISSVCV